MDWPPDSDPFIAPNNFDLFDYDFPVHEDAPKNSQVIQNWKSNEQINDRDEDADLISLASPEEWQSWIESLTFVGNNENDGNNLPIENPPRKGFSILCIPRSEDVPLQDKKQLSAYTDLPLDEDSWQRIARAFYLPGHFPQLVARKQTSVTSIARTHLFNQTEEQLLMHTAITNPAFHESPFALAATHFKKKELTLAVMFSCSARQIDRIKGLVDTWKDAIGHPFLMLGIYAELQLDRSVSLINRTQGKYEELMTNVEEQASKKGKDRFSWGMITDVRTTREESMKVEQEIVATKLQLTKACSSARAAIKVNDKIPDEIAETTNLFQERFNDISTRLDGLGARCKIISEGISFTTDVIRSELSRQEAQTSAENSKFATGISLVAMIYLPLTTMATIFAMPIFQWSNDWRDVHYRPVDSGDMSPSNSSSGDSSDTVPPVVSGYIWIYLGISIGLTVITYYSFRLYMKLRESESNDEKRPLTERLSFYNVTRGSREKTSTSRDETSMSSGGSNPILPLYASRS